MAKEKGGGAMECSRTGMFEKKKHPQRIDSAAKQEMCYRRRERLCKGPGGRDESGL